MKEPKYVGNLPGRVIYNKALPAAVRDTYTQVRGLGVGKAKFSVVWKEMEEITGKSASTLKEHLRLLSSCNTLQWSSDSSVALLVFTDPTPKSENSDAPFIAFESNKLRVTSLRKERKGKSENSDLTPERQAMERAYVDWLGYNPGRIRPEDDEALGWLAATYTPEQVRLVYDKQKAGWWSEKLIRPEHLRVMVAEHYGKERRNGTHKNGNGTSANGHESGGHESDEQLRRDLEIVRKRSG